MNSETEKLKNAIKHLKNRVSDLEGRVGEIEDQNIHSEIRRQITDE